MENIIVKRQDKGDGSVSEVKLIDFLELMKDTCNKEGFDFVQKEITELEPGKSRSWSLMFASYTVIKCDHPVPIIYCSDCKH